MGLSLSRNLGKPTTLFVKVGDVPLYVLLGIKKEGWLMGLSLSRNLGKSTTLFVKVGDVSLHVLLGIKKEGWLMGLEPTTPGTTIQCSDQLSYNHRFNLRLQI